VGKSESLAAALLLLVLDDDMLLVIVVLEYLLANDKEEAMFLLRHGIVKAADCRIITREERMNIRREE
jgi:hypothetical protein